MCSVPHCNGSNFPRRFAILFLMVSSCSMDKPWDRSVWIDTFNRAITSLSLFSNFATQTICIGCVACQRQLLGQTDCAGWTCIIPVQNTQAASNIPKNDSSLSTGLTQWFLGMAVLEISIVQDRNTSRLKTRSSLNFSFLLFAVLLLRFKTRSLTVHFYGLKRKALKSLIPALIESRFSPAQRKPSA